MAGSSEGVPPLRRPSKSPVGEAVASSSLGNREEGAAAHTAPRAHPSSTDGFGADPRSAHNDDGTHDNRMTAYAPPPLGQRDSHHSAHSYAGDEPELVRGYVHPAYRGRPTPFDYAGGQAYNGPYEQPFGPPADPYGRYVRDFPAQREYPPAPYLQYGMYGGGPSYGSAGSARFSPYPPDSHLYGPYYGEGPPGPYSHLHPADAANMPPPAAYPPPGAMYPPQHMLEHGMMVGSDGPIVVGGRMLDKKHRQRTSIKNDQQQALERLYASTRHPLAIQKKNLSKELGISVSTVQVWFQNRRARERRCERLINAPKQATSAEAATGVVEDGGARTDAAVGEAHVEGGGNDSTDSGMDADDVVDELNESQAADDKGSNGAAETGHVAVVSKNGPVAGHDGDATATVKHKFGKDDAPNTDTGDAAVVRPLVQAPAIAIKSESAEGDVLVHAAAPRITASTDASDKAAVEAARTPSDRGSGDSVKIGGAVDAAIKTENTRDVPVETVSAEPTSTRGEAVAEDVPNPSANTTAHGGQTNPPPSAIVAAAAEFLARGTATPEQQGPAEQTQQPQHDAADRRAGAKGGRKAPVKSPVLSANKAALVAGSAVIRKQRPDMYHGYGEFAEGHRDGGHVYDPMPMDDAHTFYRHPFDVPPAPYPYYERPSMARNPYASQFYRGPSYYDQHVVPSRRGPCEYRYRAPPLSLPARGPPPELGYPYTGMNDPREYRPPMSAPRHFARGPSPPPRHVTEPPYGSGAGAGGHALPPLNAAGAVMGTRPPYGSGGPSRGTHRDLSHRSHPYDTH
eukprot:Opistho-2@44026